MCNTLKIQPPPIKSIFRIGDKNRRENMLDSTILLKLMSPYDKNFLLRTISQFKNFTKSPLKLCHIGFEHNEKNFFVNENLTQNNFTIFKHALQCRKQDRIKSVFSRRGLVYIKINSNDEPISVQSLSEFHGLFRD